MRRILFGVLLAVLLGSAVFAQQTARITEEMTITNAAAVAFDSATLAALTTPRATCSGVLEGGDIRFRVDVNAASVTSNSGTPLEEPRTVEIIGGTNIVRFRAIAQTATDGTIFWTCFR